MIKVLILEDDKDLNTAVTTYLNDVGYQAFGCLEANEAYDEMYNNPYDIIVSDIMMPNIDGFEFAKTLRGLDKSIPIIFMSAKDDFISKQKGFNIGIDDYIVKPINLEE
ncbi:MAG: response regulator transcription factor [Coprobacillaceae bacterium]